MVLEMQGTEIPANGQLEFRSGSYYIMLTGFKCGLKVGDTFAVSCKFERTSSVTIEVSILKPK